jgi:hypothetical protein
MVDFPDFEKRFERSFNRVYAYVAARTGDRSTAERVTRDVLHRSLGPLMEGDAADLDAELLRNTKRALLEETAQEAAVAGG